MNPIAIRLLNQQLVAPQFSDPAEVVSYMGAMQAQEYRMMRWAVEMRTRRPSHKALTYGRTCSRSAESEQAPLCSRSVAALTYGRTCSRSAESERAPLCSRSVAALTYGRTCSRLAESERAPLCSRSVAAFKRAFDEGRIIRLHLMRGTWQLVAAEDYWMMIGLCAPKAIAVTKGWMSSNKITIPDEELMHVRDILALTAADLGSATKEDFVRALAEKDITMDDHRLSYHIRMAEMSGTLCSGELLSMKATYALTANKVKPMAKMDRDEALMRFTRKYFQSRQPATLEDFVWWSGLNISDCRKGIALLGDTIHVEKWRGRVFYLTDGCRTRGFRKGRFLLIPPYDEYLISYKSRDIVLPPEHRHHAHNNSGIFLPVIAYDGTICGNWSPFRDDCQVSFFEDGFETDCVKEAWQAYNDYRHGKVSPHPVYTNTVTNLPARPTPGT